MDEMKKEYEKQNRIMIENLNLKLETTIEEKLKPLVEENVKLKSEVKTLQNKVTTLEKTVRKNNIIMYGVKETETNHGELTETVLEILNNVSAKADIR